MAKIDWTGTGEKYFESGIDHGVLYVPGKPGVPWIGLDSINESSDGGTPKSYYLDGIKYLETSSMEEYKATISAYSSPLEFDEVDGTLQVSNGFFVANQPRKKFGLSYRTKIGNDTNGIEHGFKIHLIYNALAAPSAQSNTTFNPGISPNLFRWDMTTTPIIYSGFTPSAHFIIDSRFVSPMNLGDITDILYGTETSDPYLPEISELVYIMSREVPSIYPDVTLYPSTTLYPTI